MSGKIDTINEGAKNSYGRAWENFYTSFFQPKRKHENMLRKIDLNLRGLPATPAHVINGIVGAGNRLIGVQNFYIFSGKGESVLKLPIPPDSYEVKYKQELLEESLLRFGKTLFGYMPGRREVSFECFLPDEIEFHYTYLQYRINKWRVIEFFRKMQKVAEPYDIMISHTDIGTSEDFRAYIKEFSYRTEGTGIKMKVTFEEYLSIADFEKGKKG